MLAEVEKYNVLAEVEKYNVLAEVLKGKLFHLVFKQSPTTTKM